MKRIILFLATNIAVLLVLSVVVSVLGLDRWLMADGIDYTTLLVFSAVMGFGGSLLSLLMSKTIAKWSTGAQVIDGSEGTTQYWLVQTVKKLADKAGVGMPEVAVYEGPANAFATGAFRDSALVAVSSGLLGSPQPMIAALSRLGGIQTNGLPESVKAFGIASRSGLFNLFATHPPIEVRIAALQARSS